MNAIDLRFYILPAAALLSLIASLGCGDHPGMYQEETLTFESPISAKSTADDEKSKKPGKLDLQERHANNFYLRRIAALPPLPINPPPLFDYYQKPIPVEVPVWPWFSPIHYVHPFYFHYLHHQWDEDEDEDDN